MHTKNASEKTTHGRVDRNIKLWCSSRAKPREAHLQWFTYTFSPQQKGLNTSSPLSPNETFACFLSEDGRRTDQLQVQSALRVLTTERLAGWKRSVRRGGKNNHEKRSSNTRVSFCTPTLWWSRSLQRCRGLYLHKAGSKGCKDRDITIWCSNTDYKVGQYKVSEVSSLCLDEKKWINGRSGQ